MINQVIDFNENRSLNLDLNDQINVILKHKLELELRNEYLFERSILSPFIISNNFK
jgi:hypothetical protein